MLQPWFLVPLSDLCKVSVQGVIALGGHFATLCWELDFSEAFFFIIDFKKEKANTFYILNHSYSEKSSSRAT
jgi:hypothetical protein